MRRRWGIVVQEKLKVARPRPYVPTEEQDCETLVLWMRAKRLRFAHIANENKVLNRRMAAVLGMKRKRMGVSAGVPDYMIVIPSRETDGRKIPPRLLFLEMKRKNAPPSATAPEQLDWLHELGLTGAMTAVCRGYDAAVAAIEHAMKS